MNSDIPTIEFIASVLLETASIAAQSAAYTSWSDDFSRKKIREVWNDTRAAVRKARVRRLTIAELRAIPKASLNRFGFRNWDADLILIPLYIFNYIADGEMLTSIGGDTKAKTPGELDLDVRCGCVAFGFTV